MAQLLKIEDCVSRYEQDVFRYTGQYIRLKKERWNRVKINWESEKNSNLTDDILEETKPPKKWWQRKAEPSETEPTEPINKTYTPITLTALKKNFKEELYNFQLKWASATIREQSRISNRVRNHSFLRYMLMDLPDNYLVLYKPIVRLKKAETQLDVIIIGPDSIQAIVQMNANEQETIHPTQGRFWEIERKGEKNRIISPVSAVQRMNYFIESIIDQASSEMKFTYTILAENSYINRSNIPPYIQVVDKSVYEQWSDQLKRQPSPIKYKQLKAAKTLLDHCVTTSYLRPEWESAQEPWQQIDVD
ncbi:hypothetical protein [Pseudalkalibacillus berkeleyi]|uniref:NERD domain-containing protein n=1 Tax=Pseudalkalibacillus berkeleyi TaxID=1069813 RepID=A0ABS9H2J8_9BACL|nr:hypothetical protein [Pseudalkalibacillus berkeleyi]MCF6138331.1 hypothetical protein [Pseudalkalibacillus berkeleyi]